VNISSLKKGKGHVIQARQDPRRRGRSFGCTSCHRPHSSAYIRLFRYEADKPFDLCVHCHTRK
jgi:predicted CXXCH cytochrome family protein